MIANVLIVAFSSDVNLLVTWYFVFYCREATALTRKETATVKGTSTQAGSVRLVGAVFRSSTKPASSQGPRLATSGNLDSMTPKK